MSRTVFSFQFAKIRFIDGWIAKTRRPDVRLADWLVSFALEQETHPLRRGEASTG
jgi:hypothetical protein